MKTIQDELFDEIMTLVWRRYEQCIENTNNEELEVGMRDFSDVLTIAYLHVYEDIRKLRNNYKKTELINTESNN